MSGIAMGKNYDHLMLEQTCRLRGLMEMDLSIGEIARRMGRHRSLIHRELGRNRCADSYRPDSAAVPGHESCAAPGSCAPPVCASTPRTALPWVGLRSRSRGGWSSMDRSTGSARSPSIATSTALPAGAPGCTAQAEAEARQLGKFAQEVLGFTCLNAKGGENHEPPRSHLREPGHAICIPSASPDKHPGTK